MSESELPTFKKRRRWGRILLGLVLLWVAAGATAAGVALIAYSRVADRYDLSKLGAMRQRSTVYDAKGRELGKLHGENRVVVKLSQVSPWFVKALLAREDSRFYEHDGVDYRGVVRAIARDIRDKKSVQGASTLTMQLARNSFDDLSDKTMHRKLVEVMLARRIEHEYTKDQILELYMNRIFFGSGLYGVERASKAYFNRSAAQLTLGEAAMLAGIIRSPNRFSPFRNWKAALEERDTVLDRMVITHAITAPQADAAKKEDMAPAAVPVQHSQDTYLMEAVRSDLDVILSSQDIEDGGLKIYTTFDADVQAAAEKAVDKRLIEVEKNKNYKHITKASFDAKWDHESEVGSTPYLQGAAIVINNETGGIVAVVGGRDYLQSHYDRAMQATRTIGSTIKPFIYAAAMEHGLLPGTLVDDSPIRPEDLPDFHTTWSPQNSDGQFLGQQPAWKGLVYSRNTMTVRVGEIATLDQVLDVLRNAGIAQPSVRTPQIFIGNTGTSLRSLTSAISIFANQGVRRRPFLISRVEDSSGQQVYSTPVLDIDVLPPGVAHVTAGLMERVMDEGTAAAARSEYGFKEKAGGKTGTTNDYKDAWFVGFSGNLTTGIWVGFDQPQTIAEGAYGGKLALPIWVDIMNAGLASGYRPTVPKAELPLTHVSVCRISGQLATDNCRANGNAYEVDLPYDLAPRDFCTVHTGPAINTAQQRPGSPEKNEGGGGFWSRFKRLFHQ